jgi:hypothetical protein
MRLTAASWKMRLRARRAKQSPVEPRTKAAVQKKSPRATTGRSVFCQANAYGEYVKADIRIQLGQRTRRVQINEFKGKQLVDIREFYEKDDQMLPGKKVC